MENKCILCNGNLKNKIVEYKVYGKSIGKFPAKVCNNCNEQWFDEKTSKRIEETEKKENLFGLSREGKVSYSGNSLIIRIPQEIAKFMNLTKESQIILYPEDKNKLSVNIK